MKFLVIRIPGFVFTLLMVLPFIVGRKFISGGSIDNFLPFIFLIPFLTSLVWIISVAEYMAGEMKSRRGIGFIYLVLFLQMFFALVLYARVLPLDIPVAFFTAGKVIFVLLTLIMALQMTLLVRKVFYARSWIFLFFEFLIVPFGMISLTGTIQEWEASDKT